MKKYNKRSKELAEKSAHTNLPTTWLIPDYALESLIGRQMEIIEVMGLPKEQDRAVKRKLKEVVWSLNEKYQNPGIFSEVVEMLILDGLKDTQTTYTEMANKMHPECQPVSKDEIIKKKETVKN